MIISDFEYAAKAQERIDDLKKKINLQAEEINELKKKYSSQLEPSIKIGQEIEVEVFGEIAGVTTSIKRKGFVNKIEETFSQWDGNSPAKRRTVAYVYYERPSIDVRVKDMKHFKVLILSEG